MKLSQLSTDRALDVLCEITPYISNIAADQNLMETIGKSIKGEGLTTAGVMLLGAEKVTKLVPILLKSHRDDVYGVLAAINGVSLEEIAKQNIIATSRQIVEVVRDRELLDFFRSCAEQNEAR